MYRISKLCLPKAKCEEIMRKGRRIQLRPQWPFDEGRDKEYQERFKEMGSTFSRVWVALGGKMRHRRIGREIDVKDQRYYWRPIEPEYQRLYTSRLRQKNHSDKNAPPLKLRRPNTEIGKYKSSKESKRCYWYKYGQKYAPPKRLDFEYRVY